MDPYSNDTSNDEVNFFHNQLYLEKDIDVFTTLEEKNNFSVIDSMLKWVDELINLFESEEEV